MKEEKEKEVLSVNEVIRTPHGIHVVFKGQINNPFKHVCTCDGKCGNNCKCKQKEKSNGERSSVV